MHLDSGRLRLALAAVAALSAPACGDATGPDQPGPPAALAIVSGDAQTDTVGQQLPAAVGVKVVDADGRPVPGATVIFRVMSGGGTTLAGAATTDAQGVATDRWTLGPAAGDGQRLEVRVLNATLADTVQAVAVADAPAAIAQVSGGGQSARVGAAMGAPLVVRVADRFGNPVAGAGVAWSATGATVAPAAATTGADGRAQATVTAGSTPGPITATATTGSVPAVTFSLTATAPPPPPTPTAVSATADAGAGSVTVSWNASAGATGYRVRWSSSQGSGEATVTSSPFVHTNVARGVAYTYTVSALHAHGESGPSVPATATVPHVAPPAAAPAGLAAASDSASGRVTLSWTGVSDASGYRVRWTSSADGGDGIATGTTFVHTPATRGVTYTYTVSAFNGVGEGPASAPATALVTPHATLLAPTNASASTDLAVGLIRVTWNDTSTGETRFEVQVRPESATIWGPAGSTGANVTNFDHAGQPSGMRMVYRVRACAGEVCGPYSAEATGRAL